MENIYLLDVNMDTHFIQIYKKYKKSIIYEILKRTLDIIVSLISLIILSPILLIVALLVKADSKGPVIFSQPRVGKNGKIFKMYKFRSMVENAEDILRELKSKNEMSGPMFKIKHDPRVTRIGRFIRKTSLDELPQLINVLKGDMSLVGPRPNLPREVKQFDKWMLDKLVVRPGLTCFWQVMGRNSIGFIEWMKLDIKYVEERNLILDIVLIIKTFRVLFGDKTAS
ncbi:glycosyltransferase [Candidatus Arthromitus sp. SFB-mouse-Japan]|uniref:sugar transferase n=1 Tax=unclassified Candidatus Neoarthromitus TaxID=2638829 RepID=UPI00021B802F|nr:MULTISPECIES: sugar transferase [unclassified Candidatus Arthromitus]EIA24785.1 Putative lipopolysaccharide synthesis glycosyltransferase [Candidatus Arthromitus sp. SFB-1]EIA26223.1 Putative lipopolysaccharide synthesis putative glycosyltransferase [Candidatus Arthromitus sp. SFB-3]EIA26802.1 Putative glycosyltransferase [Candidatus Arthromitus sp. SFB-4]EIA28328.1 Putative glycosyltransferase [Candidatus Arthromitus sp. SFB-5]EIA28496.1 putative glycosyltransferase [Candidatus Arthromitus